MRRLKFVALALSGSALLSAGAAHAQFGSGIVFDPSAFKRQLEELNEARKAVQQGAQQLDEAKALYRDLNKATDIGNVANQLKNDVLRTSNVSSSGLDGYTSGDLDVVGGLRGKANDVYQDLLGRGSPTMTPEQRAAYEQGSREAAVTTGLAGNVGDAVTSRRQGLEELRGRLNSSTSAAERRRHVSTAPIGAGADDERSDGPAGDRIATPCKSRGQLPAQPRIKQSGDRQTAGRGRGQSVTKGLCLAVLLLTLAACGTKESKSDESNLRSDMPLHSAKYFMENKGELAEVDTICIAWKASQRPPLSWPAVVVNNCNNVDTAKTLLLNKTETDKLRREAGI